MTLLTISALGAAALTLAALAPPARAALGAVGIPFGGAGLGDGQMTGPAFMTVDPSTGKVFVGDLNPATDPLTGAQTFRVVPFIATGAPTLSVFGTFVDDPINAFERSYCCTSITGAAVDVTGGRHTLYMARSSALLQSTVGFVQRLDFGATPATYAADFAAAPVNQFGQAGILPANKMDPTLIATVPATTLVDSKLVPLAGNVYIAGLGHPAGKPETAVIHRYDASGKLLGGFVGGFGSGPGQLNLVDNAEPFSTMAVDPVDGSLWIMDTLDPDPTGVADPDPSTFGRLQRFSPDAVYSPLGTAPPLQTITGSATLQLDPSPGDSHMAVAADGSLYVAAGSEIIHIAASGLAADGTPLQTIGPFATGPCAFGHIAAIAAGTAGDVYVLDDTTSLVTHLADPGSCAAAGGGGGGGGGPAVGVPPAITSFGVDPAAPIIGQPATFTATATDIGAITKWEWDVDGDASNGFEQDTGASNKLTITPSAVGGRRTIQVRVRATDDAGLSSIRVLDLVISSLKPIASFVFAPSVGVAGQPVSFDASASSDPDGTVAGYAWDFTAAGLQAGSAQMAHVFPDAGTYSVRLRVTDADGDVSLVVRHDVAIAAAPPPLAPPAPGPPIAIVAKAPKHVVTIAGGTLHVSANAVALALTCLASQTSCAGTVVLRTRNGVRSGRSEARLVLGRASYKIPAGARRRIRLKLTGSARGLLRKGSVRAVAGGTVKVGKTNVATGTAQLTLAAGHKR